MSEECFSRQNHIEVMVDSKTMLGKTFVHVFRDFGGFVNIRNLCWLLFALPFTCFAMEVRGVIFKLIKHQVISGFLTVLSSMIYISR